MSKELSKKLDAAFWAHTNLATFEAVVALLEGGVHKGTSAARSAERIIKICLEEQRRQLGELDSAKNAISTMVRAAEQAEVKP